MSFLIQELDRQIKAILSVRKKKISQYSDSETTLPKLEICRLIKVLQKSLNYFSEQPLQFQVLQAEVVAILLLRNVYKQLSFLLQIKVHPELKHIKAQYKLIDQDKNYVFINSEARKIFAARVFLIFQRIFYQNFVEYKIAFDCDSGLIQIQSPFYFSFEEDGENMSYLFVHMIKRFLKVIEDIYDPLLSVIQLSNLNPKIYICNSIQRRRGVRVKRIQKYSKIMNAFLNLGTDDTNQAQSLQEKIHIEQQSFTSLYQNFIPLENDLVRSLANYQFQEVEIQFQGKLEKQIYLNERQRKEALNKLDIPQIKTMLDAGQRHFVINHVKLAKKIDESNLTLVSSGGFANIYLSEVQFFPISSHAVARSDAIQFDVRDIKRKPMILKKQICDSKPLERNRLVHEKQILLKIKSALSIFIPKYYLIYNSRQEQNQYLLIEHIYFHCHTFNLEDYSRRFKSTLSQQTIIYFAYMISQGLRYLKDFGVVHLDIKLGNIMIGKKLAVKIIDFGESFHRQLKDHRPGVSMPYSPPECYLSNQTFTSKSDVYSFGVMLYKLLFSRYPFYIHSEDDRQKAFNQGTISDRWFFSPENLSYYGENNLLIGKCLHPDPKCRPDIQWVGLLLREYLDYFR